MGYDIAVKIYANLQIYLLLIVNDRQEGSGEWRKDMIYVNVSKHLPKLFPIYHYFGKMLNVQIDT